MTSTVGDEANVQRNVFHYLQIRLTSATYCMYVVLAAHGRRVYRSYNNDDQKPINLGK